MQLKIFKLGGSKAVILPKVLLELIQADNAKTVQVEIKDQQLVIKNTDINTNNKLNGGK